MNWGYVTWTVALVGLACGTKAVGVDACEEIETARCEAAVSCGDVDDSDACARFARDNCLHGVALDNDPSSVAVERCVGALNAAAQCARKNGDDSTVGECDGLDARSSDDVCDVIREPERATRCAFLSPEQSFDDDDSPESQADAAAKTTTDPDSGS